MYANGQGVAQDIVRALMWSDFGARNGNATAEKNKDIYVKEMTSQQISEA
jgi:TPR repeat protein